MAGGDATAKYMAAEGVGVRLKSYKQVSSELDRPEPTRVVNGDLFGPAAEEAVDEAVSVEETVVEEAVIEEPLGAMVGPVDGAGGMAAPMMAVEPTATMEPKIAPEPKRITRGARKVPPKKGKRGRKSLKQVAAEADLIEIPDDEVLFSKQYYTMGEVSEMFRVNQSLLRFWETEFDILQPRKNKKGDRHFRPIDIKNLHLIYHLLRQKKYTIEGAKDFLKKNKKAEERFEVIRRLQEIRAFLLEWKAQL